MTANGKIWIGSTACGLAAAFLFAAALRPALQSPRAAAANSAITCSYIVRDYEGEVCVFQEGTVIPQRNTGILVSTLPMRDQALLQGGIPAEGRAELSAILEDYGY